MAFDNTHPALKLIILDYSMPGMSGPETAQELHKLIREFNRKADSETLLERPYICCLTAYSGKEYSDKAMDAGMDEFCKKPLSTESLLALLIKTKVTNLK